MDTNNYCDGTDKNLEYVTTSPQDWSTDICRE